MSSNNTSVGSLRAYLAALMVATVLTIVWIQQPFRMAAKDPVMSFKRWQASDTTTAKRENPVTSPATTVAITTFSAATDTTTTPESGAKVSKIYPFSPELQAELEQRLAKATEKKTILVWIPMFGATPAMNLDASTCGNCEITYDHNKLNDNSTAAVVLHFHSISEHTIPPRNLRKTFIHVLYERQYACSDDIQCGTQEPKCLYLEPTNPFYRNPDHLYVYWVKEAPPSLRMRGKSLDFEDSCHFNATMSFRLDSDFSDDYQIPALVGDMIPKNGINLTELLSRKIKKGVAVVSNCGITPGAKTRMRLLTEIKAAGFAAETFGGCFRGSGAFAGGAGRGSDKFYQAVQQYKFYFSFENSHHCKEYITEKFFNNALFSRTVPVAWGATKKDYETVAPPGSFIHVEDFSSTKELVDYLNYLDKNDTAYLEYFRWLSMKPEDMPRYGRQRSFCALCRAVHGINIDDMFNSKYDPSNPLRPLFTDGMDKRTVDSIKNWYYGQESDECYRP